MKRSFRRKTARSLILVCAVVAIGACYYAVQGSTFLYACANDLRAELVSPDARYIVASYIRDCGVDTNLITHVSIRPSRRNFDYARDARLFTAYGICDVDVEWSAAVLHIHPDGACQIRNTNREWRQVKVYID